MRDFLKKVKVFDGHEHLLYPEQRAENKTGLIDMVHYVESDLRTSGMTGQLTVEKIAQYYPYITQTGYGRMLTIFSKDLYGIELNCVNDFYALDKKIQCRSKNIETTQKWYETILVDNNLCYLLSVDDGQFRKHNRIKPIVYLDFLLREHFMKASTLEAYIEYLNGFIQKCIDSKMIAGKFGTPYWHSLCIHAYSFEEASIGYKKNRGSDQVIGYLFHYLLKIFEEKEIPIQFHTGHVEPSATNMSQYQMEWSNPNVFSQYATQYPKLKFVLLHTGFPYHNEMLSLAKNHSNIFMDFSWIYLISPSKAKQILKVALEMLPNNKIIGFGGDCVQIESVYAHLVIAKEVIATVLSEMIDSHWITEQMGERIAENLLWNTPMSVYNKKGFLDA